MLKKIAQSKALQNIAGWIFATYAKFVYKTSAFKHVGKENFSNQVDKGGSVIAIFWHGRIMMIPFFADFYMKNPPMYAMTSLHRDGRMIARALECLGFKTVGGSRAKKNKEGAIVKDGGGTRAFIELMNIFKTKQAFFGTPPDGPRGPYQYLSPGMLKLAQKTGVPVMPVAYSAKRAKLLGTWDKFMVPAPFNKGVFMYGKLYKVPLALKGDAFEKFRKEKEKELQKLTAEADRLVGRKKK